MAESGDGVPGEGTSRLPPHQLGGVKALSQALAGWTGGATANLKFGAT